MSDFSGVKIIRLNGGLGATNPSEDGIMGLIATGPQPSGLEYGQLAVLTQPADAASLGIDASYDANNGVLVYHHIEEFFRLSPAGILFFMLLAQTETLSSIADNHFEQMIRADKDRKIKYVGVVANRASDYSPTWQNGLDADVLTAIAKFQAVIDKLASENIFVDGVMLGAELQPDVLFSNLQDLHELDARDVSVLIAEDPAIRQVSGKDYAAVGSGLGMLSIRKVHENIGSLQIANMPAGNSDYSLTDNAQGLWLSANLSNGRPVSELSQTDKTTIANKGYIFAGSYEGYPGIFFNNSFTCTELTDDFSRIERNRTWNKAARKVVKTLTPRINSDVEVDTNTGYIKATTIAGWQADIEQAIGQMQKDGEISGFEVFIDPKQNVLSGEPLKVQLSIVPKGIAEKITAEIGFKNPLI